MSGLIPLFPRTGALALTDTNNGLGIYTQFLTATGTLNPAIILEYIGPSTDYITPSASAGAEAGVRTKDDYTMRTRNPVLEFSFNTFNTTFTGYRLFIGFYNQEGDADFPTGDGTDPLLNRAGIALTVQDGNFKIAHNDSLDSTVFSDFDPPVVATEPVVTGVNLDEINNVSITGNEELGAFTITYANSKNPDWNASKILTADIPERTTKLSACAWIISQEAAIKRFSLYLFQTSDV